MVREHVWCLLEFSQLQSLLALAQSVSSLGGGLPALMVCLCESALDITSYCHYFQGYCTDKDVLKETVTKDSIHSAMMTVHIQLSSEQLHSDAELLLEICQHARYVHLARTSPFTPFPPHRCDTWSLALALLLQHMPVVVSFQLKRSHLWEEIYKDFSSVSEFAPYFNVMKELGQHDDVHESIPHV